MKYHLTVDFVVKFSAFANGYGGIKPLCRICAHDFSGNRLAIRHFAGSGLFLLGFWLDDLFLFTDFRSPCAFAVRCDDKGRLEVF